MASTDVNYRDFTKAKKSVEFQIDDDMFVAPKVLPIPVLQQLAGAADALKTNTSTVAALSQIVEIFDIVLIDSSAVRLRERINSKEEPVDLEQLTDILFWLLEVYGLRPTQSSSDSSAGLPSEPSGLLLTAGVPSVE